MMKYIIKIFSIFIIAFYYLFSYFKKPEEYKWFKEIPICIREEMPLIISRTIVLVIGIVIAYLFKDGINLHNLREFFLGFLYIKFDGLIPFLMGLLVALFLILKEKIGEQAKSLIDAIIALITSISVIYFVALIAFPVLYILEKDSNLDLFFLILCVAILLYIILYLQLGVSNLLKFLLNERKVRGKTAKELRRKLRRITKIHLKKLWHNLETIGYSNKAKDD